jgi:hypothetical protein
MFPLQAIVNYNFHGLIARGAGVRSLNRWSDA